MSQNDMGEVESLAQTIKNQGRKFENEQDGLIYYAYDGRNIPEFWLSYTPEYTLTEPDSTGNNYFHYYEVFYDKQVCQSNKTMCDPPIVWVNPNDIPEGGGGPGAGLIIGIIFAALFIGCVAYLVLYKLGMVGPKVEAQQINISNNVLVQNEVNQNTVTNVNMGPGGYPQVHPQMQG